MLTITLPQLVVSVLVLVAVAFAFGFIVRSCIVGPEHQAALRTAENQRGYKESALEDKERAWKACYEEREKHEATRKELKAVRLDWQKACKELADYRERAKQAIELIS